MAFVVTARKWRPKKFSEVVGQEHITTTLKNAIKNNRIAHAYLFTGPRGVGKTTTARIFAKSINCLNPQDGEPCNECEMCKDISALQSMDIIEIDGASNRGIDEIRTLRDSVKYAPTKGKYKVYIIDEVHMLTRESFNAFLKTLEEPPAHTIFIFATTDVHKVPLTIISRCQRFDFRRIQLDTIKSKLAEIAKEEKIKIDDKTLTTIAKKSDGALRDAESFFDQVVSFCGDDINSETVSKMLNLIDDDIYFKISDAVLDKNFKTVFEVTNTIYDNGWNFIDFVDGLIEHFRNIMTVILTEKAELVETAEIYKSKYMEYIDKFSEGDILRLVSFLNKTQQELRYAQNQKLKIEIALSHLIGLEKTSTLSSLISSIDKSDTISENKSTGYQPKQSSSNRKASDETVKKKSINKKPDEGKENPPKSLKENKEEKPSELNFNIISAKWNNFIEEIKNEKGLTLGHFLEMIEPQKFSKNKLEIACSDENAANILGTYDDYFQKKSLEFFGKKLRFHFIVDESLATSSKKNNLEKTEKPADENDPFVKVIIEELGGEEIS